MLKLMMRVRPLPSGFLLGQIMSTNESEHKSVVIGVLGVFPSLFNSFFRLTVPKALQGAFIEHQVMLQELTSSLQVEISANLVRSVQDLHACDALVLPGGGMLLTLALTSPSTQFSSRRIDNDCSPRQKLGSPWTSEGVRKG